MTTTGKLRKAVEKTKSFLENGFSIVLSLWKTGEARTKEIMLDMGNIVHKQGSHINIIKAIAEHYVRKFFVSTYYEENKYALNPGGVEKLGRLKTRLLGILDAAAADLCCFVNSIDFLKEELGGQEKVAELTGRSKHWVSNYRGEKKYVPRNAVIKGEDINISEQKAFQSGRKLVAIISSAASTGISLHSNKSNPKRGQRPRINIVLELPWAADSALQQMGRVHRTNQVAPPKYIIMVTELGGERRFVSAVTARLESLGALTRGDRGASFAGGDHVKDQSVFQI